jgi:catechol 2,3-dioxygenase-like lactoylglutathione lyase family enzyme
MGLSRYKVAAAVAVSDMDRARDFYEEKLGFSVRIDSADNVQYLCGEGTMFHVYLSPEHAGNSTATLAGWGVDDIERVVDELASNDISQCTWIWDFHLADVFRLSFGCARLFDFQVGLLSLDSGRLGDSWSFGLSNRWLWKHTFAQLRRGIWPGCWHRCAYWGTSIFPLACDQRRKRPRLQRTGPTGALGYA